MAEKVRQAGRLRAELWWELRIKEDTRCLLTRMQKLLYMYVRMHDRWGGVDDDTLFLTGRL